MTNIDQAPTSLSSSYLHTAHRAQVDTTAQATVTPFLHLLHGYKAYDDSFKCPIRLVATLDSNAKTNPIGEDLLKFLLRIPTTILVPKVSNVSTRLL